MVNNDQDPDALPDFEPESDFSEFEDQKSDSSLGGAVKNNPLIKLGLVAAGLIVVVGGVVLFGGKETKAPVSSVGSANELKETPGTSEVTPVMKEALEEYNDQQIQAAVNSGDSVMPVPIDPPKNFLPADAEVANNTDPLQKWRQMQEDRLRVQREQEQATQQSGQGAQVNAEEAQALQAMSQAMTQVMGSIAQPGNSKRLNYMEVTNQTEADSVSSGSGNAPGEGASDNTPDKVPKEIVIPAGTILYAQLLNEANSDVVGPIMALVAQGPFSGSRILGSFNKSEELLTLRFSTLVTKQGFSVPIQALGIDPDTTLGAMASEVDHRYFKRVILPAAASFIEGVGQAIGESGSNTSVTIGDGATSVTEDNSDIDTEEELAKGVEKAFEKVGEIVDDEADETEVLVIVKAGTPMGIMFLESVTKRQLDDARYETEATDIPKDGNSYPYGAQQNYSPFGSANAPYGINGQGAGLPASLLQGLQSQQGLQGFNMQNSNAAVGAQ